MKSCLLMPLSVMNPRVVGWCPQRPFLKTAVKFVAHFNYKPTNHQNLLSSSAGLRFSSHGQVERVNNPQFRLSSTSSFEAPEPPEFLGQAIFPDIQFQKVSEDAEQNNHAFQRNNDQNAVFVVNGASRGIGLQLVKSLSDRTKGIIIACCRSPAAADDLNQFVLQYPQRIRVMPLDMEDQYTIDTLVADIAHKYQRVDALFNVAGILGDGMTTPGPERSLAAIERWWMEKSLAVHVIGPVMLIKALSPLMRSTGRRILTIESESSKVESRSLVINLPSSRSKTIIANLSARVGSISDNRLGGWYSYRLSKSALNQATRTMGLELNRQGIWIVALHPGTTNTALSEPFQKNVQTGRLFPVDFTVNSLLHIVESLQDENSGGFYG